MRRMQLPCATAWAHCMPIYLCMLILTGTVETLLLRLRLGPCMHVCVQAVRQTSAPMKPLLPLLHPASGTLDPVTTPSLHVQAVPALGVKGSVVDANAGWMRHKLFPQGRAVYATPKNIEQHSMVGLRERIRRGREGKPG